MQKSQNDDRRTVIHGAGWKKSLTIATDKFEPMAKAIMSSLDSKPMKYSDLVERVRTKFKKYDGSIPWYTITCIRELEIQGKVIKHTKPVRYSKA